MTTARLTEETVIETGAMLARAFRMGRAYAGLTQGQVAHAIGVEENTVTRWETGRRIPELKYIGAMAVACGLHPLVLLALGSLMTRAGDGTPLLAWFLTSGQEPLEEEYAKIVEGVEAAQQRSTSRPRKAPAQPPVAGP